MSAPDAPEPTPSTTDSQVADELKYWGQMALLFAVCVGVLAALYYFLVTGLTAS